MHEMTNKNIFEAGELPQEEKVYLKKDFLGWRVVHPSKNIDGSTNWFNMLVGGKRNLVILIIALLFLFGNIWYTNNHIAEYKAYCEPISKDPVKFCENIGYYNASLELVKKPPINYDNLSLQIIGSP